MPAHDQPEFEQRNSDELGGHEPAQFAPVRTIAGSVAYDSYKRPQRAVILRRAWVGQGSVGR